MKFKNGEHVKISANAPKWYRIERNTDYIVVDNRIQSSLKLKSKNAMCYYTIHIQEKYLERKKKYGQLHFKFS